MSISSLLTNQNNAAKDVFVGSLTADDISTDSFDASTMVVDNLTINTNLTVNANAVSFPTINYVANFTGAFTFNNVTLKFQKIGSMVFVDFPLMSLAATAADTINSVLPIPASLHPAAVKRVVINGINNNNTAAIMCQIDTLGNIVIGAYGAITPAPSNFGLGTICGVNQTTFSYSLL